MDLPSSYLIEECDRGDVIEVYIPYKYLNGIYKVNSAESPRHRFTGPATRGLESLKKNVIDCKPDP